MAGGGACRNRHVDPLRRWRRGHRAQHGIHEQGEAGRGLGRAVAHPCLVAPPAPELAARAEREQHEGDAGVVLEAPVLDRVHGQADTGHGGAHQRDHLGEPAARLGRRRRQVERLERRKRTIGGPARLEQGGEQPGGAVAERRDLARVLAVERRAHPRRFRVGKTERAGDCRHHRRNVEIDREALDAGRGQRLVGERDHLGIGARTVGTDQLDARLPHLALGAQLRAGHLQHLARVAQAQRARLVGEAGRGDTRDLQRHVGTHAEHGVADRVHQPEGLLGHGGAGTGEQALLELHQRRLDLLIARRPERAQQTVDGRRLERRVGRENVVHPRGEKAFSVCVTHESSPGPICGRGQRPAAPGPGRGPGPLLAGLRVRGNGLGGRAPGKPQKSRASACTTWASLRTLSRVPSSTDWSVLTSATASPPALMRPRPKVAMLMPEAPRVWPSEPMKPGLSWLVTNSMCWPISASTGMPLTSTRRGLSPPNSVPETERLAPFPSTVTRIKRVVVAGAFVGGLGHVDVALACDHRRVDHVDRVGDRREQALEHDRRQRPGVEVGDVAVVVDGHRIEAILGELAGEAAKVLGELHVGLELGRVLGRNRRHVEGVHHGAGHQEVRHLLGDLQRDVLLRFRGGSAEMRRAHHVVEAEVRALLGGLLREHVEGGAGDLARLEGGHHVGLDHQLAAGAVDDAHAVLHLLEGVGVDDVAGRIGERRMQRNEVGAGEQVVQLHLLDAEVLGPLRGEIRIEGDDLHLEAERPVGDDRADVAATDDAEGLGGELHAHEAVLLPFAGLGRGVGGRDVAGEREHHGDGVLGGGDRVAERRVHDDHAAGGGFLHVDVVDADAGAADHLEVGGLGQHVLGDLGGRAHRQTVVVADAGHQLVGLHAGLEVHLDAAILEDLDGGGRQFVGNENLGHLAILAGKIWRVRRRVPWRPFRPPSRARGTAPRDRPCRWWRRPRPGGPEGRHGSRPRRTPRPRPRAA